MATEVVNDLQANSYALLVDGERVGRADYDIRGDDIVFTHTEVDQNRREKGLGSILVEGALEHVRTATDYRVVAECPFVKKWLERNPGYQDLQSR